MIRYLYEWVLRLAEHRYASWWLFGISFAESSFFPIPPDFLLIPITLQNPKQWWQLGLKCTIGSVFGGALGYAIGYFFFALVGEPLLHLYGYDQALVTLHQLYEKHGWWLVLMSAITPLPYKVFTITSGALQMAFWPFIALSLLGRGFRFFIVALVVAKFGHYGKTILDKHIGKISILAFLAIMLGFLAIKLIK